MREIIPFLVGQYYDIQKLRIEAYNRLVSLFSKPVTANDSWSPPLPIPEGTKPSEMANQILHGKLKVSKDLGELVWYHNSLHETEKNLSKKLDGWSKTHLLRTTFFDRIKGIGPTFGSALIAWLEPISRFDNISKLWSYCGMAPNQKRRKGEKLHYNPHLKTLMWKVSGSFIKQNAKTSFFRRLYDRVKTKYLQRQDLKDAIDKKQKGAKLHVELMTRKYIAKRFLAYMWLHWRQLEHLPITKPYAFNQLEHSETSWELLEFDKEL